MNIAYLLYWPDGPESGVFRKVLNQIANWKAEKHEVTMILAGPAAKKADYEKAVQKSGFGLRYFSADGQLGRWLRWRGLKQLLQRENFSVVYHRFDMATPGLTSAMLGGNWVVEINSNDLTEYGLTPGLRNSYNRLTRGGLFGRAGASVFPTRELAVDAAFKDFNSVREVIPNGADLTSVQPAPALPASDPIQLLFMGTDGQPWHGVNKLPALAEAQPNWIINVLGISPSVFPNGAPANLKLRNRLPRHEYEPLLKGCTGGIGSLGLHRISLNEACPLKVREYLAFGLPVILGYTDSDVPAGAQYALQLPNTEDNVATHLREIAAFVESWRGRRVAREQVAHMDWTVKEKARLALMDRVAR